MTQDTKQNGSRGVVFGLQESSLATGQGHYFVFTKNSYGATTFLDGQTGTAVNTLSGSPFVKYRVMVK